MTNKKELKKKKRLTPHCSCRSFERQRGLRGKRRMKPHQIGITVVYRYTVKSGIHVTKRYRKKRKFFNPGLTMGLSRIKERIN